MNAWAIQGYDVNPGVSQDYEGAFQVTKNSRQLGLSKPLMHLTIVNRGSSGNSNCPFENLVQKTRAPHRSLDDVIFSQASGNICKI
jgi:hypothetical protein